MKVTLTNHAKEERMNRLTYIAMTIGFGEVVFERIEDDRRYCITDSGVLMVKALKEEVLITAYIVTIDKAIALYRNEMGHDQRMPNKLYDTIRRNAHHAKMQNKVVF